MGKPAACDVAVAPPYFPQDRSRAEVEQYCEKIAELEAIGVTWLTAVIRQPSKAAYLDTLAWYSEEIMARFDRAG